MILILSYLIFHSFMIHLPNPSTFRPVSQSFMNREDFHLNYIHHREPSSAFPIFLELLLFFSLISSSSWDYPLTYRVSPSTYISQSWVYESTFVSSSSTDHLPRFPISLHVPSVYVLSCQVISSSPTHHPIHPSQNPTALIPKPNIHY